MSSSSEIFGAKEVAAKLLSMKNETFRKVVTAVEKTAVRMSNHAKSGHEIGSDPHSRDRYENQTNVLTQSISPGDEGGVKFEKLSEDQVRRAVRHRWDRRHRLVPCTRSLSKRSTRSSGRRSSRTSITSPSR